MKKLLDIWSNSNSLLNKPRQFSSKTQASSFLWRGKNTIWISEQVEGTFAFFSPIFSHRNFVSDRCFRNIPSSSFVPGKIKKRRRCSKKEKKRFLSNQPIKKFQIKLKTCGWRCYFWSRLTRLQLFARACALMLHLPQPLFAVTPVSFALIVLRSFSVLGR